MVGIYPTIFFLKKILKKFGRFKKNLYLCSVKQIKQKDMAQKEYHNYPIGTKIYPRDNSFQKLIKTYGDWDKEDHSGDLYLKPCIIYSKEYKFVPKQWYFNEQEYPVVNVLYNGGIYRISISEFWDLTTPPTWIDEIDDFDDGPF